MDGSGVVVYLFWRAIMSLKNQYVHVTVFAQSTLSRPCPLGSCGFGFVTLVGDAKLDGIVDWCF